MITRKNKESLETTKNYSFNETLKTIYERRAIRQYKNIPVSVKLIEQIIDAGRMAPSAMNKQPWKFYVLTDKKEIKDFSKQINKASIKGIAKMGAKEILKSAISLLLHPHDLTFFKGDDYIFHGAPVVIFITAPKKNEWAALDIGACMQNIMLAAKALGLDSCPVGLAKFVVDTKLYEKLNIPKNDDVIIAVIVGYSDEVPELHKRKKDNLFFIN